MLFLGESCSLVDIPTYLLSSVELATRLPAATAGGQDGHILFGAPRPRLRIDLTKKRPDKAASGRRTQWTVLCVAVTMMTMCVTLVGAMLSVGSEYQNNKVALSFASIREAPPPSAFAASSSSSISISSTSATNDDESVVVLRPADAVTYDRFAQTTPPPPSPPAVVIDQTVANHSPTDRNVERPNNGGGSGQGPFRFVIARARLLGQYTL